MKASSGLEFHSPLFLVLPQLVPLFFPVTATFPPVTSISTPPSSNTPAPDLLSYLLSLYFFHLFAALPFSLFLFHPSFFLSLIVFFLYSSAPHSCIGAVPFCSGLICSPLFVNTSSQSLKPPVFPDVPLAFILQLSLPVPTHLYLYQSVLLCTSSSFLSFFSLLFNIMLHALFLRGNTCVELPSLCIDRKRFQFF